MKKIFLTLTLAVCALAVNAQKWEHVTVDGDELRGTSATPCHQYMGKRCGMMIMERSSGTVVAITIYGVFNFDSSHKIWAKVGYYDASGKMTSKEDQRCLVTKAGGDDSAYLEYPDKVLYYLKHSKGFVRVIAPVYDGSDYDLKVPCFNNASSKSTKKRTTKKRK